MTQTNLREHTAPGDTTSPQHVHPAFEWLRSEYIASLNVTIEEYHHRATGALHYHMVSDNPENVFLVAFRTVPMDSTGVAHILEHTALCGSKHYPVRDPFFMMVRRSLNTFMNAFTSSDWTAYPFASKNRKDFDNLLQVYLDAAFFSLLDELDFAQEGHRLEFSEIDNPDSELLYKGVVFNEMKGAMSSTNSVLWHTMSSYLFPTTTYHYNSGGDPEKIPDLSYAELKEFYRTHYHPSNAVFMTFGDIPAHEHHTRFEELALKEFSRLDVDIHVEDERRYEAPIKVTGSYAAEPSDSPRTHIVIGWLLGRSTNLGELFRAQLLCGVLLDNSSSPLLRVLETSDLGQSPSPMCGLEDSNREMTFMAGLEGCEASSTDAVEQLVLNTLREIAETGVDQEQVEAALHQLELSQREISGDSYPYGLQLILGGLSAAVHRGDPIKLLHIDPVLAELREQIKDSAFIPRLIQDMLLSNKHQVTLTMTPDTELAQRRQLAEAEKLAAIKHTLDTTQQQKIVAQAQALLERQSQDDDPEMLPKVSLKDVPASVIEPERVELTLPGSDAEVSYFGQGTNGLAYQQIVMPIPNLAPELIDVLALYTSCLTELGVGEKDYTDVQSWQAQISGGVNCFSSIRSALDDEQQVQARISFSSKSLLRNHGLMSDLLKQTLESVRFDEGQRMRELVEQICTRKESSITGQGHSLAMNLASSRMSPVSQLTHCFGGLEGIKRLQTWRDRVAQPESLEELLSRLSQLHDVIQHASKQFLLISEAPHQDQVLAELGEHWQDYASQPHSASMLELPAIRERVCEAWTTATQVNFCAKAFPTVPSSHPDNPVLHVLAGFLRNGFLHRAIREKGGAYGGGAGQDASSASFRFFSYRDPRLQDTLDDFDRAVQWVIQEAPHERLLEEAILGVISTLDKPSSPAGEAKQAFYNHLFGRSLEFRQLFRQRVLATTMEDIKAVAERYLTNPRPSFGIICSRENANILQIEGLEVKNIQ